MRYASADGVISAGGRVRRRSVATAALGAALVLGGCHHDRDTVEALPPPPATDTAPAPTAGLSPRARYAAALDLLARGQEAQARAELIRLRQDTPRDRRVDELLAEIDTDPKILYGTSSFAYQVTARDTLIDLAGRFLKSRRQFYGLAKFNGLTLPVTFVPGQTIMIPGRPRQPEHRAPRPTETRRTEPAHAAAAADKAVDPAAQQQAQRLRRTGLEEMSAGSIDRAAALLGQAAALDPQNGAIAEDLARARRIQGTVHSHN